MFSGFIKKEQLDSSKLVLNQPLRKPVEPHAFQPEKDYEAHRSDIQQLQLWAGVLVVLPVFLQAPWVRINPLSACLFTVVLLGGGIALALIGKRGWVSVGELLVGVSGSWLAGCLFWGWLRAQPCWHLPVESLVLPIALIGLSSRWRVSSSFYLASLVGTACTDLMMVLTGVMNQWPAVVEAPLQQSPQLLHETAQQLLHPQPLLALISAAALIVFLAQVMQQRVRLASQWRSTWAVASSVLLTTVLIDGLFLFAALINPALSGLI
ncbi:MAG: DUF3120 domain-containing protein [Prochlorococcus sp.]|nr:DUF3120 domain-containing protein [Prochlorococcaceae cyanobacterium Fu_MAG_72]